jgi:hypothetical protein
MDGQEECDLCNETWLVNEHAGRGYERLQDGNHDTVAMYICKLRVLRTGT